MRAWQQVFRAVPRRWFIPDTIWVRGNDGYMVPLRRTDDPGRWLELCDDLDESIVTQVDDGAERRGVVPTSSSSAPFIMARMLDALDVEPGMRVLEIGTGTGYNAALLAEQVGTDKVTTVEVDPTLAEQARTALKKAGYPIAVVTGDGLEGYPPNAPYDRGVVTAAATRIPYAWIEQTRPGGKIVVPWMTTFDTAGALVPLTVHDDGTASGPLHGPAAFMALRAQRLAPEQLNEHIDDAEHGATSTTALDPGAVTDAVTDHALGLCVNAAYHAVGWPDDPERYPGEYTLWLVDGAGSWASVDYEPHASAYTVEQYGPRQLWDELETAYRRWVDHGRPERERLGLTVTPERQYVWLDSPDGPSWELPS